MQAKAFRENLTGAAPVQDTINEARGSGRQDASGARHCLP